MNITDLTHFLDSRGMIAPRDGPARQLAEFVAGVVAHASDFDRPDDTRGPTCLDCSRSDAHPVETAITEDDVVVWHCPRCEAQGRVSGWQGSFWDLSTGQLAG